MSGVTPTTIATTGAGIKDLNSASGPLVVGYNLPYFLSHQDLADYTNRFQQNAASEVAKKGVFANLTPDIDGILRTQTGQIREVSFSIGERDIDLHNEIATANYVNGYNKFLSLLTSTSPQAIDLSQNNYNNSFMLQSASNLDLRLGNGNNIVMASPMMASFSFNDQVFDGGHGFIFTSYYISKIYSNVFYPSAQGKPESNTLTLGNGNNLIYYDSSFKAIKTGNGNNVFVPSFGSFNWSYNDLHIRDTGNTNLNALPADRTLLNPIPLTASAVEVGGYAAKDLYTSVYNFTTYGPIGRSKWTGTENAFQMYQGNNGSVTNNRDNLVGGAKLIGGLGDDLFYGSDPSFYDGIPNRNVVMDTVSGDHWNYGQVISTERKAFDEARSASNTRLALQKYETIEMLGGGGSNTFVLGNPNHLKADGSDFIGRFSYIINVGHQSLATDEQQGRLSYGARADDVNAININLSANVKSYTLSTASYEQSDGESSTSIFKAGSSIKNAVDKYNIIGGELSKTTFSKFMRAMSFGYSAITAAVDTVGFIKDYFGLGRDPDPVKLSADILSQPLGTWRQAVNIDDWNPGVAININVDPTITTAPAVFRWKNIKFDIKPPNSGSQTDWGVTVTQQQGSDAAADLLFLKGFGSTSQGQTPLHGYYSYDFHTAQYRYIDQGDLAFIGNIAFGVTGISPLKNYQASNGFVFATDKVGAPSAYGSNGTYSFYWNDPGINPITGDRYNEASLEAARNAASSISLKFDSRTLGWFWDPKFVADPASGPDALAVDRAASKLWVELAAGQWTPFTLVELSAKPLAYSYALRANTFYQTNYGGVTFKTQDQLSTEKLVESLKQLDKTVADLGVLGLASIQDRTHLTSVEQITFVKSGVASLAEGVANPVSGTWIYHLYNDPNPASSDVFKVFVQLNPVTHAPEIKGNYTTALSFAELYQAETNDAVDINLDGVIGAPAAALLKAFAPPQAALGSSAFVTDLYGVVFNRAPDAGGLAAWTEALNANTLSQLDVIAQVLASSEFTTHRESPEEFVELLYRHLFQRDADEAGKAGWVEAMDRGLDHASVVRGFAQSAEMVALTGVGHHEAPAAA